MAVYKCSVCGYLFTEEPGKGIDTLTECPICGQPRSVFEKIEESESRDVTAAEDTDVEEHSLEYDPEYARTDESCRYMAEIHKMAVSGEPIIEAMGTRMAMPDWDDILLLGAQLNPMPLPEHAEVDTTTIIGKHAKKPMVLESPVYISHMSFGALSRETKVALAQGSAMAKTAMCSGEGGVLPEEMEAAYKYIFEYVPNKYSVTPENLKGADAIEIKIGQGTKPGMGGHLPADKVTPEDSEQAAGAGHHQPIML